MVDGIVQQCKNSTIIVYSIYKLDIETLYIVLNNSVLESTASQIR
jgi:hypothetical protein